LCDHEYVSHHWTRVQCDLNLSSVESRVAAVRFSLVQGHISPNLEPDFGSGSQIFVNLNLNLREPDFRPSENWHRENLSEYEFIGSMRCQSEDFQCESEKVRQLLTTSDNSELCPYRLIDHSKKNIPNPHQPCPCPNVQGAMVLLLHHVLYKRNASRVLPLSCLFFVLSPKPPPPPSSLPTSTMSPSPQCEPTVPLLSCLITFYSLILLSSTHTFTHLHNVA